MPFCRSATRWAVLGRFAVFLLMISSTGTAGVSRIGTSSGHAKRGERDETSPNRRLPMRQDSLRDHRSSAVGLHLPLHRLPTPDEQRLLHGSRRGGDRLASQRNRAATTPAHRRQWANQHPVSVSGVRLLGLRHGEGWRRPRACRHTRRYLLVATDKAYLDPQQTALDYAPAGR